jgi:hypothetical protein
MIVDCEGCVMRDLACGDCVVTFLLGPPERLGAAEQVALAALADGGLVPPLRLRTGMGTESGAPEAGGSTGRDGGGPGRRRRAASA